ncbi:hypothetical protein KL908_003214 [Ogataea polymorpha]|nr:hypothetical protein KL908_003214 [Ogataea polymorpha]
MYSSSRFYVVQLSSCSQAPEHIRKPTQTLAVNVSSSNRVHVRNYPLAGDEQDFGVRILEGLVSRSKMVRQVAALFDGLVEVAGTANFGMGRLHTSFLDITGVFSPEKPRHLIFVTCASSRPYNSLSALYQLALVSTNSHSSASFMYL